MNEDLTSIKQEHITWDNFWGGGIGIVLWCYRLLMPWLIRSFWCSHW